MSWDFRRRLDSFCCAAQGVRTAWRTQWNMRFHFFAAAIVLATGVYFPISRADWIALVTAIALVLVAESLNTAMEFTVNLVTRERHPLAGHAKDVAAGAVLLASVVAVVLGALVFGPHIVGLLGWK